MTNNKRIAHNQITQMKTDYLSLKSDSKYEQYLYKIHYYY